MSTRRGTPEPADQRRALSRVFLTRFFENDITGGSNDLTTGFFWLVGFLAAPGFLIPVLMMHRWETIARFEGIAALRQAVLSSKLVYLCFGMVASGLLAALTWNNLLLDRLDALILGALPVRRSTIVAAKLTALAGYLKWLTLAMHGLAAIMCSLILASGNTPVFFLRGIIAHFAAASAASVLVFLAVASVQGLGLAVVGPRRFARVSTTLQIALIAWVLISLTLLPSFAQATRDTLAGAGPDRHPWMLWTPPFWFLGTYECLLGTNSGVLISLHVRGMVALAIGGLTTVSSYLVAYRRLSRSVVEGGESRATASVGAAAAEWLTQRLSTRPAIRAAAQLIFTSGLRVDRLRFVLSVSIGVAVGWSLPVLYYWALTDPSPRPPVGLLALSLADIAFVVTGLRIAIAIPSDTKALWILPVASPAAADLRAGTWRAMFAIGVASIVAISVPVYGWFWGPHLAIAHACVLAVSGALLVEILLWNHDRMPHAAAWRPDRAAMGKRWPLYVGGFVAFTAGIAAVEDLVLDRAIALVALVAVLGVLTAIVRRSHTERWLVTPRGDDEDPGAPVTLNLQ